MSKAIPTRIRQGARWSVLFLRYMMRQFYLQRGPQVAAALAYTTLLSIVPLLTVMFAFPGGMPMFAKLSNTIQSFLFNNFVPAFGHTVQSYLGEFSRNASKLTATGLGFLVVVALMLMETIDNSINAIWRVRTRRSPMGRFLLYWAMITLGPFLIGIGLFSTSYLMSLQVVGSTGVTQAIKHHVLSILPFLTSSAAFSMLYLLVPNCKVRIAHALCGGVIAAVLFELAKMGFGFYVKTVPTEAIYGAIAVVPLFFIWIYTSWVIVLLGAHLSSSLGAFGPEIRGDREEDQWAFEDAFNVIRVLWQAQSAGKSLALPVPRNTGVKLPQHVSEDILEHLERASWVKRTADRDWVLTRSLDSVTLWDLHCLIPRRLPLQPPATEADVWQNELDRLLDPNREALSRGLDISLAELLRRGSAPAVREID